MNELILKIMNRSFLLASVMLGSFALKACSSGDEPLLPEEPPITEEPSTPEEDVIKPSQTVKVVKMNATDIVSGNADSRTSFKLDESGLEFAWAEGDKVGVWPTDGSSSQVEFTIKSGAGQNSAKFDGGAWALREEMQYTAYYPYIVSDTESSNSAISFSYEGQSQKGNASLAHLGSHDLMATHATSAVNGELNFEFEHVNCAAQLRLTAPVAAIFTTLTVRCDEAIFAKTANLDLSGSEYQYSISEPANQIQMSLSEVASTEANQELTFYMMLPPVDMAGKTVYVVLQSDDNKVYQGTLPSKTMVSGKAYSMAATLVDVTVSSQISSPGFGASDTEI